MRSRNIKPGFFENEALGKLDPLARLLFAGLWCIADRQGRLEDRPARIRAKLLPYDRCDINKLLDSLEGSGFISRYQVKGNKYLWVINFLKHQNPHVNEKSSVIPAHVEIEPCTIQEPEPHRTSPVKASTAPADSLISEFHHSLVPETRIPDALIAGPVEQSSGHQTADVCADEMKIFNSDFQQFISDWPHQVNLSSAERTWKQLFMTAADASALKAEILAGKARYQASDQWARGVYDGPDKWLLNKKWKDQPAPKKTTDFDWAQLEPGEKR